MGCVAVNCDFRESSPQAVQSIHVKYVPNNLPTFTRSCMDTLLAVNHSCPRNAQELVKWSYTPHLGRCTMRKSLSCESTDQNLFHSKDACEERCMTYCDNKPQKGPCNNFFFKIGYENTTKSCEFFI